MADSVRTDWLERPTAAAPAVPSAAMPATPRAQASYHLAASRSAPEFAGWAPTAVPADVAQDPAARAIMTGRAEDLERNEPLVSGAVLSHKNSALGTGLDFQSTPDYAVIGIDRATAQAKSREIEAIWREWAEDADACDFEGNADFGLLTRMSGTHDATEGESLGLVRWEPERQQRRGVRFATTFQVLEPERLSNPMGRWNDLRQRDGVEVDPDSGETLAYHIAAAHPGDPYALARRWQWARVPARFPDGARRVVHSFDRKWAGQHRGLSWLTPAMGEFKMANRYSRAELQAAVVNAVIAAVLETPLDGQGLIELFQSPDDYWTKRQGASDVALNLGPGGLIPRLFPGEKLGSYASSRPNANFDPFMTAIGRRAAAALGMPYEVFMRDFSRTNYSSARASMLEGWRSILVYRLIKAVTWCKPVQASVIDEAVWRGYIDLPGYMQARRFRNAWLRGLWLGPARGWVDPVKEIQAAAMRIKLGISSLRDEAQEQGRDWLELLDQLELEREELTRRGLSLPEIGFTPAPEAPEAEAAAPEPTAHAAV